MYGTSSIFCFQDLVLLLTIGGWVLRFYLPAYRGTFCWDIPPGLVGNLGYFGVWLVAWIGPLAIYV
jgi:hypothetical protein